MNKSLLFLPDISGFTEFVNTTEIGHSQQVIAELLEVLINTNTLELKLAEIEGDALFFYKEGEIPSLEMLLAQVETMFTAFYSHLKLLKKNRICPCNACSSAPNLQLKIIAHSGTIQFITVQDKSKPFGIEVIQAHRLMKNSINSANYVLFSKDLADEIKLLNSYQSKLFTFHKGDDEYDAKRIHYLYSIINKEVLKLKPYAHAKKVTFDKSPSLYIEKFFPISASHLLEYITNYTYRNNWAKGVDKIEFNEKEVTRVGSEHVCVINGKHLNFTTITKDGKPDQLIYGELTTTPTPVDELYQFFILNPTSQNSCKLEVEIYWKAKSPIKKLLLLLFVKKALRKNVGKALDNLLLFVEDKEKST